jgi:hypothetical protein
MTLHRLVPSEVDTERLSDLVADARAIPAAAFSRSTTAVRRVVDLTAIPLQRTAVRIPPSTTSPTSAASHPRNDEPARGKGREPVR